MSPSIYHGKSDDRRYVGQDADVTYSLKRCIHAEECVHRLAAVFDPKKRPWIDPTQADGDTLMAVIALCPSGALHGERKDGGSGESVPPTNTITLRTDGPLEITGDLAIQGAWVDVQAETRAALCRCGASRNKPFCDNSHRDMAFVTDDPAPIVAQTALETGGGLTIIAEANGPLEVNGVCTIYNAAGNVIYMGEQTWLCRCGGSNNKPFCDGTHKTIGFQAE